MREILDEFEYINAFQMNLIKKFSDKRKRIFDAEIVDQDVDSYLKLFHKATNNVNRYITFNYRIFHLKEFRDFSMKN